MYRRLRLCSGGGGFEAIPEGRVSLDLPSIRARLESEGIAVVDARVMLVAAFDPEVTVSGTGRLLFKTPDETLAERAFRRLEPFLATPSATPRPPRDRAT